MSAERGWWLKPVIIERESIGRMLHVNNTRQAARMLLEEWPATPGPKHLAARRAVLAAMEKALDAKRQAAAREAFRQAAIEAGIADESAS